LFIVFSGGNDGHDDDWQARLFDIFVISNVAYDKFVFLVLMAAGDRVRARNGATFLSLVNDH
jgi:hypothetical protein